MAEFEPRQPEHDPARPSDAQQPWAAPPVPLVVQPAIPLTPPAERLPLPGQSLPFREAGFQDGGFQGSPQAQAEPAAQTAATPVDATIKAVLDATRRLDKAQAPPAASIRAMVPRILAEAAREGITDPAQIAIMLANASHESQFNPKKPENLNYTTPARLLKIFPSHFSSADQTGPYLHNPEGLANRVYAGQDGNGNEASGDGWTFRGRGLIQTTHRGAYRRMTQLLKDQVKDAQGQSIDFEKNPDALSETDASVAALVRGVSQGALTQGGSLDSFLTKNKGRDATTFTTARKKFVGRADAGTVGRVTADIYQAIKDLDFRPPKEA